MQTIQFVGLDEILDFLGKQDIKEWKAFESQTVTIYDAILSKFFFNLIKRKELSGRDYEVAEYGLSVSKLAPRLGHPLTQLNIFNFELPHKEVRLNHPLTLFYGSLEHKFKSYKEEQLRMEQEQTERYIAPTILTSEESLALKRNEMIIENEERHKGMEELIGLVR